MQYHVFFKTTALDNLALFFFPFVYVWKIPQGEAVQINPST